MAPRKGRRDDANDALRPVPNGVSKRPRGSLSGERMPSFAPAVTNPAQILVVEDDTAIRQAIVELLQEEGYTVTCASNGAEALAQLDHGAVPSLILLDLTMPVMDGWTFRAAQQSDPRLARIPTVVVSASQAADSRTLERLAPDAFLPKPFNLDRLIATVERLC